MVRLHTEWSVMGQCLCYYTAQITRVAFVTLSKCTYIRSTLLPLSLFYLTTLSQLHRLYDVSGTIVVLYELEMLWKKVVQMFYWNTSGSTRKQ